MSSVTDNISFFTTSDYETQKRFSSSSVRNSFAKKVLGIVSLQLLLTTAIIATITSNKSLLYSLAENSVVLYTNVAISIACLLAMSCSNKFRRQFPFNYIALLIFTVCNSVGLSFAVASYSLQTVLLSVMVTFVMVLGLGVYSFVTERDFTLSNYFGVIFLLEIFCFFMFLIMGRNSYWGVLGGCASSGFFAMALVFDLQLLMDGKRRSIEIDDYVFGALNIYLDVVNLFIEILKIVSKLRGEDDD